MGSEVFSWVIRSVAGQPKATTLPWHAPGSVRISEVFTSWAVDPLPSALSRIAGPWAVAVPGPDDDVFLVCDPVGVQPLYWSRTLDGGLVAASWLESVVTSPGVDATRDAEGLLLTQGCGMYHPDFQHRTAFRSIFRLPGGTALRIRDDGSTSVVRYWDPAELPGPDDSLSLDDCVELTRERLELAVRNLTPRSGLVAAHVSGGLDSSAVASLANRVLLESRTHLECGFSWSPSGSDRPWPRGDERHLVDAVSAHIDRPVHMVPGDESAWFWDRDPALYPDSTHFREAAILPSARKHGIETLMSGWGGDRTPELQRLRHSPGLGPARPVGQRLA